jgi:hypothetical protein
MILVWWYNLPDMSLRGHLLIKSALQEERSEQRKQQLEQNERRYSDEAEGGCSEGNLEKVEGKYNCIMRSRSQSKILRMIADAPWYVSNQTLHDDLKVPYVNQVIKINSQKHHQKIADHPNTLLHPIIVPPFNNRRLKRTRPADLKN